MAFYWICGFAALLVVAAGDDSCPTPEELAPCTCDGEGLNCMGDRTLAEIKKAFRSTFKYNGVRSVWIQGTPITDLPADTFSNIKSQQFFIEVNNIVTIDVRVFNASRKTLSVLSLYGNKIKDFSFQDLNGYDRLSTLNLGRNEITTIPDNAFSNRALSSIIMAYNKIAHIGKNAFSKLPNLSRLELSANKLGTLGPMSMALSSQANSLQINLSGNWIADVDDSAFSGSAPNAIFFSSNRLASLKQKVFLPLVNDMGRKGGFIEVSSNPFTCRGCDYKWLVVNKEMLASKLGGFRCSDGRQLLDLTANNIGCQ